MSPADSQSYLQQLADGLPQLVWSCKPDGNCEFLNQRWSDYTGIATAEQLGRGWLKQFHPEDEPQFLARLQNVGNGNDKRLQLECRIRDQHSVYRWFEVRAATVPENEAGKTTVRWCGSCIDIDSRRQANDVSSVEAAGHRQSLDGAYLAALIENSNDAIVTKTIDGVITSWNRAAERIFGYTAGEIIGQPITWLFPPERIMEEAGILACINAGQAVRHYQTQRLHKSGRLLDLSVSVSPIRNADGTVVGVAKIARDITEQKAAEQRLLELNDALEQQVNERTRELQHAHRELQEILDAMPSLVGYWDKQVVNRFSNHAYQDWFEESAQEIAGKHMCDVLGEKRFQENLPHIQAVFRGEAQAFERSVPSKDGSRIRHVLVHYVPRFEDGAVDGFYALVYDVTALKQTEAALKAANHELEAFSYAVAHDLRSPLRAMIGFSEALQEECAEMVNADAKDYLGEIIKASKRMGQLIDGLLALSRSTQGTVSRERIDMSALVENIRTEYERVDSGRKVQWEIEPDLVAWGDPRMIEMALRNLIDNACKYAGRVAVPRIRFYSQIESGVRSFCIADNGAGFDMAHANRLFKPFQRLHRQDEFAGIGIGLATVKRIVQRHGGTIDAISAPGRGATFYFTLGKSLVTGAVYEPANIAG